MSAFTGRTSVIDIPRENKLGKDYFGIDKYSDSLVHFIRYSETPITIAIQGEWGSGKTSLMNYVREQLCDDGGEFYGVWINTWEYSLLTHDKRTLINIVSKILDETVSVIEEGAEQLEEGENVEEEQKKSFLSKSLDGIRRYSSYLKPLAPTILQVGIGEGIKAIGGDASFVEPINNMIGSMRGNSNPGQVEEQKDTNDKMVINSGQDINITDLRKNIEDAVNTSLELNTSKKGFLFFIDDLDRLEPSIAVDILEVLKNIFTIKNCVFVLAIDYEVIVKGLEGKFGEKNNSNEREFRSFFEKIIQVPFSMPVNSYKINEFVRDKLEEIGYFQSKEFNIDSFMEQACKTIGWSVGQNPRSLKRLINSLSLITIINRNIGKTLKEEYEEIVHFAMVCIQTAYPKIYTLLQYNPSFLEWNEEEIVHFTELGMENRGDSINLNFLSNDWEKSLYVICLQDNYLRAKSLDIIKILTLIEKVIPRTKDVGQVISEMLQMSFVTNVSTSKEPVVLDKGTNIEITEVTQVEGGYRVAGYYVGKEEKYFYTWSLITDDSMVAKDNLNIYNYPSYRKQEKIINIESLKEYVFKQRLRSLFLVENSNTVEKIDESVIRIFDISYHPILSIAYEIEESLDIRIVEKIAEKLSNLKVINDMEILRTIFKTMNSFLEEQTDSEQKLIDFYQAEINSRFQKVE